MMSWRKCSTCKQEINFSARYFKCSVSTCNRQRTGMVFCSEPCWDAHVPVMNHRDAWTEEAFAPDRGSEPPISQEGKPERRIARPEKVVSHDRPASEVPQEILIVASRLKAYVKARSGMNTSDGVMGPLSNIVRRAVDEAIEKAQAAERKTVLERDVERQG